MANGNFGGGDGTQKNPYLVEDAYDLDAIRNNLSAYYKQIKNIDLSDWNWNPIGADGERFVGAYDGNGYSIENLTIARVFTNADAIDSERNFGLFRNIYSRIYNPDEGEYTSFTNIKLININIDIDIDIQERHAGIRIGGLAGELDDATIKGCHVEGRVNCRSKSKFPIAIIAGGIIGWSFGYIVECSSKGLVDVRITNDGGTISQLDSGIFCGGICGIGSYSIRNCYSECDVSSISNMYYTEYYNRQLAGSVYAGGICGDHSFGWLFNCYSTGNIHSENLTNGEAYKPELYDWTFSGGISAHRPSNVGDTSGVVSLNKSISSSHKWDYIFGNGFRNDKMLFNLSEEEAKKRSTYENLGWDFDTIWSIYEGITYPFLKWQKPPVAMCKSIPLSKLKMNRMEVIQ